MSDTTTAPASATYFTKLAQFPEYALKNVAAVKLNNDTANANAKGNFDILCNTWLASASNHGLAVAGPKPIAPLAIVTHTLEDEGGIYVWQTDGDPVGVCPDPSTPTVASGSLIAKAPPGDLDIIKAMLQQILANQAKGK